MRFEYSMRLMMAVLLVVTSTLAFNVRQAEAVEPPETEWTKIFGGSGRDHLVSVIQTSDGGYTLIGGTASFGTGDEDFWLAKTDENGNMQWNKTYGGIYDDSPASFVQTDNGGYAIAGYTKSFGAGDRDFWLVKVDSFGNHEWNRTYGGLEGDEASSVVETRDGGYAVAGRTFSFGAGIDDFWLVKTDGNGNVEWSKTYGGIYSDFGWSVVQTNEGGYALGGFTNSVESESEWDLLLIKTDASGNMQWNTTYGGPDSDIVWSLIQTSDGGYALSGTTESHLPYNRCDYWLVKTDSNGNVQWNRTYAGIDAYNYGGPVAQTNDGGYVLSGSYRFSFQDFDIWIVRTDSNGALQWSKSLGGAEDDTAAHIVQTDDGGYAVAGTSASFDSGGDDFWFIKIASEETSNDADPPDILNISQTPPENNVLPSDEVTVCTTVSDNQGVSNVFLNYTNGNGTWIIVGMTNFEGSVWNATIPAFPYCTNVTYAVLAEDNTGNIATSEGLEFETRYHVIPEVPSLFVLPLLMIATLLAAILTRKKQLI